MTRRDPAPDGLAVPAERRAVRRILIATVVVPLAAAVLVAVGRLGFQERAAARDAAVGVSREALAAYEAERAAVAAAAAAQRSALSGEVAASLYARPAAFLGRVAANGYDAALYLDGRRVRGTEPGWGPDTLSPALSARLRAGDQAFAATLPGGRLGAVAPVKDLDEWEVVGALLVAPRAAAPARLPAIPLGAGAAAWLLTAALCWRYARTRGRPPGAALFFPPAAFAAWLLAGAPGARLDAAPDALWPAAILGAWAAGAAIGLGLVPLAARPLALREATRAWAFLAPSLLHLLVFSIGPIAFALFLSLHEWNLLEPVRPFVGLDNYRALLRDAPFWRSVANTAVYVLFVPIAMAVALGLALLVNRRTRGVRLLRTAFFLPYVTSFVAISLIWKWMFEPELGLLNSLLRGIGLPAQPWLTAPSTAMPSLMLMSIWLYGGYMMVLFLAGLQNIPASLYESARIDGATAWQRFRWITLPLLRPTTFFVLATMVIFMFQVFTAIYVMTEGGPLHATDVIVYHIYRTAWEYLRMGYASAMAWVLFTIVFVITLFQYRLLGARAPHE